MSRRWTGRGSGLAIGCLVSAITLLGSSAPRAFADTPPISAVTITVDATTDDAITAVNEVVTSDITDSVQETSGDAIEATADAAAQTTDATSPDIAVAEPAVVAPDVVTEAVATDAVPDGTSQEPVGVTEGASETSDASQEVVQAVEVTVADVTSAGVTTDEDAAANAIAATLDSAAETTPDAVDTGSDTAADAIDTISAEGPSDEKSSSGAVVAVSETTSDVVAMISDTSTDEPDAPSGVAVVIGDATVAADLATLAHTAPASVADPTLEISADITNLGDMASDAAAAVVETFSYASGMMTDVAAEATSSTQPITETAIREASAITVEPFAAVVDEAADATWATFETVATEASATVSDVTSLETVAGATSTVADATNTVSDVSSEVITAVEEVLVSADVTAHTVVDSTTTTVDATADRTPLLGETATQAKVTLAGATADTISEAAVLTIDAMTEVFGTADQVVGMASETTTDTVGAGPDGTSDAVATLSEAVSAVIAAISGDGALADPTTVLNGASETVVSDLDPASLQEIRGGSSRDQRFLLSVNRGQTEGERFPGNEPVAACEDASSLNCALTGSADGIDSLVESVASIIRILALTGLTLLPWVVAAGMLASLGGLALAGSRRRRATGSVPEEALPRGSHVKDAWAYS